MSTPTNLHSGFHRTAHKSFVHLLGGFHRDVIELPMNRVDANFFKRKPPTRIKKNHSIEAKS